MVRIYRVSFFLHAIAVCSVSLMFSGLSMAIEDEIRLRRNNPETSFGDVTREQILETRNRRKRQLKVMLVDARKKLADHSAGEKPLTEEAKAILVNSIDVYRRKIESMEGELEEWVSLIRHDAIQCEYKRIFISKAIATDSLLNLPLLLLCSFRFGLVGN